MSGFSIEWLSLREPVDHRSHAASVIEQIIRWARGRREQPVAIIDLGAGTGSNLRYLLPKLPVMQNWLLVDADPTLLTAIPEQMRLFCQNQPAALSTDVSPMVLSLADRVHKIGYLMLDLGKSLDLLALDHVDLVCASALFDLVSENWFVQLADDLVADACRFYARLNYDGRMKFSPEHPFDQELTKLVNHHQKRDKGFGPAMGPDAANLMAQHLRQRHYLVATAPSDWRLDQNDQALLVPLLEGLAQAAVEQSPDQKEQIESWAQQRLAKTEWAIIGHQDLWAEPV